MSTAIKASECPDVKNYKWRLDLVWHRMLYSCTNMATVGFKGLNTRATVEVVWTDRRPRRPVVVGVFVLWFNSVTKPSVTTALTWRQVTAVHRQQCRHYNWLIEQCFMPPLTQYRLYGRRFLQVKRPNQQYQSTEGDATKEKANKENN